MARQDIHHGDIPQSDTWHKDTRPNGTRLKDTTQNDFWLASQLCSKLLPGIRPSVILLKVVAPRVGQFASWAITTLATQQKLQKFLIFFKKLENFFLTQKQREADTFLLVKNILSLCNNFKEKLYNWCHNIQHNSKNTTTIEANAIKPTMLSVVASLNDLSDETIVTNTNKRRKSIEHDDTQHNDIQNNGLICDNQHKGAQHNDNQHKHKLSLCWV